ncbi:unnamed protein product [Ixodes persulcatus]
MPSTQAANVLEHQLPLSATHQKSPDLRVLLGPELELCQQGALQRRVGRDLHTKRRHQSGGEPHLVQVEGGAAPVGQRQVHHSDQAKAGTKGSAVGRLAPCKDHSLTAALASHRVRYLGADAVLAVVRQCLLLGLLRKTTKPRERASLTDQCADVDGHQEVGGQVQQGHVVGEAERGLAARRRQHLAGQHMGPLLDQAHKVVHVSACTATTGPLQLGGQEVLPKRQLQAAQGEAGPARRALPLPRTAPLRLEPLRLRQAGLLTLRCRNPTSHSHKGPLPPSFGGWIPCHIANLRSLTGQEQQALSLHLLGRSGELRHGSAQRQGPAGLPHHPLLHCSLLAHGAWNLPGEWPHQYPSQGLVSGRSLLHGLRWPGGGRDQLPSVDALRVHQGQLRAATRGRRQRPRCMFEPHAAEKKSTHTGTKIHRRKHWIQPGHPAYTWQRLQPNLWRDVW